MWEQSDVCRSLPFCRTSTVSHGREENFRPILLQFRIEDQWHLRMLRFESLSVHAVEPRPLCSIGDHHLQVTNHQKDDNLLSQIIWTNRLCVRERMQGVGWKKGGVHLPRTQEVYVLCSLREPSCPSDARDSPGEARLRRRTIDPAAAPVRCECPTLQEANQVAFCLAPRVLLTLLWVDLSTLL